MKSTIPKLITAVGVTLVLAWLPSQAQQIYSENFDTDVTPGGNWVVNAVGNSPADLFFDYSTVGIPPAPNSAGTTRGVKLGANLVFGTSPLGGVSVSPLNFGLNINDNWVIHADWWINFNGPAPGGGSGSTQVGGMGYGTTGGSAQIVGSSDSLFFVATGEGGSSADFRIYSAAVQISMQDDNPAYLAGGRNAALSLYATNFGGQTCPAAQLVLYPQQSGATAGGSMGWQWHDFKIEKLGPFVTWSVDGIALAVVDATTNGIVGDKLLLTHSDINAGASTDANAEALAFSLFDNLRVSNVVANVVTVSAAAPTGSEFGPTPITFTFSRTITGSPLTVNYQVSGLAANGVDYTNILGGALTGTLSFGASDNTRDITVVPIDDAISEPEETVTLAVASGVGYIPAGSASGTISDNDTPLLIISASVPAMFERHTNDFAGIKITRWGDPNAAFSVEAANLVFSGSAIQNTHFVLDTLAFPLFFSSLELEKTNNIVMPLDDSIYTGNKTILVGLTAGTGFGTAGSNAVLTIIDDENPPATVLYSNPLDNPADAVNWGLTYANGDLASFGGTDYEASFGYDLVADPLFVGPISRPPSGATRALRATVNKINGNNAGLNLYPTNVSFSGDYAVRFNMNIIIDTAAGTTQGPLFGINHNGQQTNWWAGSGVTTGGPWASDGLWYWVSPDGGAAAGDYLLFTGNGGSLPNTGWQRPAIEILDNFVDQFKGPPAPYTGSDGPGLVGNAPPPADNSAWTDVEIKQLGRQVVLYLNKTRVLSWSNSTSFTSGKVMLGYADPFNSVGGPVGAVYYSNLRVVQLAAPQITSITRNGSNVTLKFASPDGTASVASFSLQKSANVTGTYAVDAGATITQLPDGSYQATTTSADATQFYRISQSL